MRDRDLYSRDVYIANNYSKDIGQGAIQLANTKDMMVEYNEVNGFLQRYNQVSAGLYLWAGVDSVMQFNEVYDGPYHEYDATPWDLEFTNFNVTYQYNYSHDNKGGWMSYMRNSGNSIARYNLSVNDNGVIVKNMLSSNYSPTYILNNVFVYDAAEMDWFHDEVFIDTVYFLNNVFYNYSTTTTTPWYRRAGALNQAVFSNNAFYEASGNYSSQQPHDAAAVIGDPLFIGDVADYKTRNGVTNIVDSASLFQLQEDSPLIDAGRYNPRVGEEDFFGRHLYYGNGIDIGIHEQPIGRQITNPVDTDPIEDEGQDDRTNLALGVDIVASSTHPHQNFSLHAGNLVDGNFSTRWAAADDAAFPLTIDLTFPEATEFDEVLMAEHIDSGTDPRVAAFTLSAWDENSESWQEFYSSDAGIGAQASFTFDPVTSPGLRVSLLSLRPGEQWTPTMTEIQVFRSGEDAEPANPAVDPGVATYDQAEIVRGTPNNSVTFTVAPDGDLMGTIRYVGTEGNVLGSLTEGIDYVYTEGDEEDTVSITDGFLSARPLGESGLRFEFASGAHRDVQLVVVDSTTLADQLAAFDAVAKEDSESYEALAAVAADAREVLALANREVPGTGNAAITQGMLEEAAQQLEQALAEYEPSGPVDTTPPTVTVKDESKGKDGVYSLVSFKLYDQGLIDKVVLNGVEKDLSDNVWSDLNSVKPGVFGAVLGVNTITLYDIAGNETTRSFTLVEPQPSVPAWEASMVYTEGDEVSHNGAIYVAQWWTQNQAPGQPTGAWAEVGALVPAAGDGVRAWTPSWIYTGGETVSHNGHTWRAKWWTRDQAPGAAHGPWEDPGQY